MPPLSRNSINKDFVKWIKANHLGIILEQFWMIIIVILQKYLVTIVRNKLFLLELNDYYVVRSINYYIFLCVLIIRWLITLMVSKI